MKISKIITVGVLSILGVLFLMIFRPVPIPSSAAECLVEKGTVINIHEGGVKDVVFQLAGSEKRYYINRGLENGLDLNDLKLKLLNQEVTLKYPKYWTPLDWDNSVRHLSQVEFNGEILYTEI